jgi:hypothetical protein
MEGLREVGIDGGREEEEEKRGEEEFLV